MEILSWGPAHDIFRGVMVHIVILVDRVSKDPEVVNTGKEVHNTEGVVLSLADVTEKISTSDLDPMVFDHDP